MRGRVLVPGLLALLLGGCLSPDDPVLETVDTAPPRFVSATPAADPGAPVPVDTVFALTFSEGMDVRTLRPGIWLIRDQMRVPIDLTIPPDDGIPDAVQQADRPYTVRVHPTEPLAADAHYQVVLDTILSDTEGNLLDTGGTGPLVLEYRTEAP